MIRKAPKRAGAVPPPPPAEPSADVTVANHGSIWLITPITPEADEWFADHLADDVQWFGGGVAVEPRYVSDLLEGLKNDGLVVK